MLRSEREAKLEQLNAALSAFVERERGRLLTERAFLLAVRDLSTGKLDKAYAAAANARALTDVRALLGVGSD